jgi:hypothetical protein
MAEPRTLDLGQPSDHLGDGVIRLRRFDRSDTAMPEQVRRDPVAAAPLPTGVAGCHVSNSRPRETSMSLGAGD